MKKSKSDITKSILIESALDVLCQTSYKGAKLQDVADKVGLSRGAIYWNFKNKLDLYDQVLNECFCVGMREMSVFFEEDTSVISTVTKLINILLIDEVEMNHKSALLYNGLVVEQPEGLQPIIAKVDQVFKEIFLRHNLLLERGVKSGELNPDIDTKLETRALYSFIWGYYTNKERFFSNRKPKEIREYVYQKFVLQLKR